MPEYLVPGVFVGAEIFRAETIEGIDTGVAGLVGPTGTGPVRGRPELLTSFANYRRIYGDVSDLVFSDGAQPNYTAIAAKAFFDEGGKKLFVARVSSGVNLTGAVGEGRGATFAAATDTLGNIAFRSRFPGARGNYTLEVHWRYSENLLRVETTSAPAEGEVVFVRATGIGGGVRCNAAVAARVPDDRFPLHFSGLVKRVGNQLLIVNNLASFTPDPAAPDQTVTAASDFRPTAVDGEGVLLLAGLGPAVSYTRVHAKLSDNGTLSDGTSVVLTLPRDSRMQGYTEAASWGTLTRLHGTLSAAGTQFTLEASGVNSGVDSALAFYVAALAADPAGAQAVMVQRNFDLDVFCGGVHGELVHSYANISTAVAGSNSLSSVLNAIPDKRSDLLMSPISCTLAAVSGDDIVTALYNLFDPAALASDLNSIAGPRYLIALSGGTDGAAPVASDYAGEIDRINGSTGFAALEDLEDISIVMAPAAAAVNAHQAVVAAMQNHCCKMRYRIGLVDSRAAMSLAEVRDFRSHFNDSRLALYYPWVIAADPSGLPKTVAVPASGFIAGVYARADMQWGVQQASHPASLLGGLRTAQDINRFQQELLNSEGINCLLSFADRDCHREAWRTLSCDPQWQYLNVRRYFLYLERTIEKSTQWVVCEANGERLWASVRTTIENFLYREWLAGKLLGATPRAAYLVRCDRSTMTQSDIDHGRLICDVGVAALAPGEYVSFRIDQKTADA